MRLIFIRDKNFERQEKSNLISLQFKSIRFELQTKSSPWRVRVLISTNEPSICEVILEIEYEFSKTSLVCASM